MKRTIPTRIRVNSGDPNRYIKQRKLVKAIAQKSNRWTMHHKTPRGTQLTSVDIDRKAGKHCSEKKRVAEKR